MTRSLKPTSSTDGSPRRAPHGRMMAIVPAFNEAGNVGRLVEEIRACAPEVEVVVVDDGSADETATEAASAGARVLRLPFNCGIGATVQAGLMLAVEEDVDLVVRLDGDGQHDPRAIDGLLGTFEESRADLVLGSRFIDRSGYQSTATRRLGVRWFAVLLRVACGLSITDPTSGLWLAGRRAIRVLADEYSSDYPEVDSLVRLQRNGCRVVESPVAMRPRGRGHSSIGRLSALYYMVKVTVALLIGRTQPRTSNGRSP